MKKPRKLLLREINCLPLKLGLILLSEGWDNTGTDAIQMLHLFHVLPTPDDTLYILRENFQTCIVALSSEDEE